MDQLIEAAVNYLNEATNSVIAQAYLKDGSNTYHVKKWSNGNTFVTNQLENIMHPSSIMFMITNPRGMDEQRKLFHSKMKPIKNSKELVKALKELTKLPEWKEGMDEALDETVKEKYFLVNKIGSSVTSHTSQPFFNSPEEAKEYQKKYKHVASIKSSKIVKGDLDQYGFIRTY